MFERFTEASRAVLVEAQDVAVELGSGHLGVGHVLYGCAEVRDETAGRPLRDAGVTGSLVRQIRELKARRLQPGHLLLGVLRTDDEAVSRTLTKAGITAAELEATIIERLSVRD